MSRRRVFAQVSVFLLLGVVANVAVAWSIAMWSSVEFGWPVRPTDEDQLWWERNRIAGKTDDLMVVGTYKGIGADAVAMIGLSTQAIERVSDENPPPGAMRPSIRVRLDRALVIRSGLPMRSLYGSVWHANVTRGNLAPILGSAPQPMTFADVRRGAIELDRPAMLGGSSYRLIPFRPMWPGFVVNTIFYAIVLWLVLVMPRALRRRLRIRRSLCPACAYPIGTSPVCTECGAAVSAYHREVEA